MNSIFGHKSSKEEAWDQHHKKYECEHNNQELRRRTIRGGAIQYRYQCLRCGEAVGSAVASSKAAANTKAFDEELYTSWVEARQASAQKLLSAYDKKRFFESYNAYLKTDEWKAKRRRVLERARGICEGCLEKPATQVHHLTYDNVGDELLFQLVAICDECHDKCHPERQQQNEVNDELGW